MASKNCVKISYKGLTRQIVCDQKFQYDDLLKSVMNNFNIENSLKLAIEFYDEQGHKFNKDTFKYLLLLFPNPQKIFFIRLDTSKMCSSQPEATLEKILEEERQPFGRSKTNYSQTTNAATEPDIYCEAVPVRRQNCFLGELPGFTTTSTQTQTSSSALSSSSSNRLHPTVLSLDFIKRLNILKQSSQQKKHLNNPNQFKRSLRL